MLEGGTLAAKPEAARRRSWKTRFLFVFGLVAFSLLIVELSLQLFYRATVGQWLSTRVGQPIFRPDPDCVYSIKPHLAVPHNTPEFRTTIHTNGQGLRVAPGGADYALGKQPGRKRIVLMGPSFAFGWGVDHEQTFAAILEDWLNRPGAANQERIEVANAGIPSMGPALNLEWYRNRGKKLEPDLVIQFIYGSMTVPPNANWNEVAVNEDGFLINTKASGRTRLFARLKQSATVFFAWNAFTNLKSRWAKSDHLDGIQGAGRDLKLHGAFDPADPDVANALEYYRDLRATVAESGAKLLVVFFPLSYCIHKEDMARWTHLGARNVEQQMAFNRAFCEHLRQGGLDCLDITERLREAAEGGERLYYFVDIHWTPEGNEVAASAVRDHLVSTWGPASGRGGGGEGSGSIGDGPGAEKIAPVLPVDAGEPVAAEDPAPGSGR